MKSQSKIFINTGGGFMTAKKLSAVILALPLLVSLFGCSFNSNSPDTDTDNSSATSYPFADLTVQDIESVAYVFGVKHRIALTADETEEFVSCIQKIEIGNETDNIPDGFGHTFEILKTDGTLIKINSGGLVTFINGEVYECKNDSDRDYREFSQPFWQKILELTS